MVKFNIHSSVKHVQIDKANTRIVVATAISSALVVFSIVASISLMKQMVYQNKVINLRSKANTQLQSNLTAVNSLVTSYQSFDGASESVIGNSTENSVVVLDALPSKYDFPALVTSIGSIITNSGDKVNSITGTDNGASAQQSSISPQPVQMPFQTTATGSLSAVQKLINNFGLSIRPFQITELNLSGSDTALQANITGQTYYQPEKEIGIQQQIVSNNGKTDSTSSTTQGATK